MHGETDAKVPTESTAEACSDGDGDGGGGGGLVAIHSEHSAGSNLPMLDGFAAGCRVRWEGSGSGGVACMEGTDRNRARPRGGGWGCRAQ